MNPAEGWNHRRRWAPIDIDAPTTVDRVIADLAANPGTTSREMAGRLRLSVVAVSGALGRLRDRGKAGGLLVRGAYQWTPAGLALAPRLVPELPSSARGRAATWAKRRAMRDAELEDLVALLRHRFPRKTSIADACVAMRWARRRAEHRIEALAAAGRAVRVSAIGVAGLWVVVEGAK